ncbi:MAG TPA: hypothetical protein VM052_07395 [Candidatus Limnocylindrales bacterium]|nr:hypothetical protein [Candidatus Limnocylindrales bacterium]
MSAGSFLLDPADRARRRVVRLAALTALGRACMRDRGVRLPLLALAHGGVALVLATVAPMWTLLIGPLFLGVPHLVADLRYLVIERPHALRTAQIVAIAIPLVLLTIAGVLFPASGLVLTVPGIAAVAGAVAFAGGGRGARAIALVALAGIAVPLCREAPMALLVLAHAHNAIAIALWLALSTSRRAALRGIAAVVLLAGAALIASGALDAIPVVLGAWITPAGGFDPESVGESLALPGLGASRSLMLYAYAQAVHYAVWLRLVPGERSATDAPVSFRRGAGGLRAALGAPVFVIAIVVAVALPLAGFFRAAEARHLYLEIAGFHAWLELAVGAHLALAFVRPK